MIADKFYNITNNGETIIPIVKNPATRKFCLVRVVINTKGASSNVATIYDSNATIGKNPENRIGTIDTTAQVGDIDYGLILHNGIFVDMHTGTAADITLVYKETA